MTKTSDTVEGKRRAKVPAVLTPWQQRLVAARKESKRLGNVKHPLRALLADATIAAESGDQEALCILRETSEALLHAGADVDDHDGAPRRRPEIWLEMFDRGRALALTGDLKLLNETFEEAVESANAGDEGALAVVRRFLKMQETGHPLIPCDRELMLNRMGTGLTYQTERILIAKIAGKCLAFKESVTCELKQFKAQLAGANPSPVETAIVDAAGVAWLASLQADRAATANDVDKGGTSPMLNSTSAVATARRGDSCQRSRRWPWCAKRPGRSRST